MSQETKFADIIIPLAVPKLFTYRVPKEYNEQIMPGQRVVVQFGKSKLYTGIVRQLHTTAPSHYEAKYIDALLDDFPVVNQKQFALWEWMSNYYLCHIGEVMNAALPSGLKLVSETKILLYADLKDDYTSLNDDEFLIVQALENNNKILSINDVCEILGRKNIYNTIKSLIEKNIIILEEELKEKYKPKTVSYVKLRSGFSDEKKLKEAFDLLGKAPKQLHTLMMFIQLSQRYSGKPKEVGKVELQKAANITSSIVKQLEEKKIFEVYEKEEGRIDDSAVSETDLELSNFQVDAFIKIKEEFKIHEVALLHGVTSSGKTEIYVKLIQEALSKGQQVLYLLPEIALTTQLISRLKKYFGEKVGVYHSRFNQNERVEVWNTILADTPGKYDIILGARSSLFLPFTRLGLIIVDEEHETSFKQFDPAPRYNARDAAIFLASIHKAKTLLGTATPSYESYHNAENKKYGIIEINERFGGVQMPEIIVDDIKEAARKKLMKSHFSPIMLEEIEKALNKKEQVILFQNRRGYSPYLQCETCGHTPQCTKCDVSLTWHKQYNELRCHYCGYRLQTPKYCSVCGDANMKTKGFGTEKIEEELSLFFPEAKIDRLDFDTTRSKNSYRQIISRFEENAINILVGTQMVTKGLDFENVALVGILNADSLLNFPDFRAHERSFQLMAQVAGRAGRKNKRGKVIIQTFSPAHYVIQNVASHNYLQMYNTDMEQRNNFNYPPFSKLILLTAKNPVLEDVNASADFLAGKLKEKFGTRVLGPEFPLIARIRNLYLKNILLKIEKNASLSGSKKIIAEIIQECKSESVFRKTRIAIDVDPV